MQIRSRAPLRLGFAGGGTDVSPYCDIYGGLVMNATIDMYAYANIALNGEKRVCFVAKDKQQSVEYPLAGRLELDGTLDIHKGVYNRIVRQFNQGEPIALILTTFSDAPAGSGLGSSSTLVVAMVKAFVELLNLPLGEYDIAQLAYQIEREDVGLNGGKQDQYAATFGGFNFMEFNADNRVIVNPLRIKNWIISELESSIVLFYTGVSRESAAIVDQQSNNVKGHDAVAIQALHEVKAEAATMKECLLRGNIPELGRVHAQGLGIQEAQCRQDKQRFDRVHHSKGLCDGGLFGQSFRGGWRWLYHAFCRSDPKAGCDPRLERVRRRASFWLPFHPARHTRVENRVNTDEILHQTRNGQKCRIACQNAGGRFTNDGT
jgi:D-glycero-alpha-D-manno-heptose-7-phosphate kinase